MKYIAIVKDQEFIVEIDPEKGIIVNDEPYQIDFRRTPAGGVTSVLMNQQSISAVVEERGNQWEVLIAGDLYSVEVQDERAYRLSRLRSGGLSVDGEAAIASPMPGIIVAVPVTEGQVVHLGDKLVILESMKMENELRAPCDGVVTHVNVTAGASVDKDQVLVVISQHADESAD